VFTSSATAAAPEASGAVAYSAAASDADGDAITFSIDSGVDAALFSISAAGALSFRIPADFEAPADQDRNNVYEAGLRASDGRGGAATLDLRLSVMDIADAFQMRRRFSGLAQPLFLAGRGDGSGRVFIIERAGRILIGSPDAGTVQATPFLDLTGAIGTAGEGGLLGFATAPDFATSGVFYVHVTNLAGDSEIRRYAVSSGNADVAEPTSQNTILFVDQPAANHNGGWIGFSNRDDNLYIAFGDGGGSNDQFANGQNTNTLLGAILRIDPSRDDFPSDPLRDYAIPPGNPFIGGGGRPEIFAYGLRNPFRASFDRAIGNLYIGDVGQDTIEEIDRIGPDVGGLNFGWPILEGTRVNGPGAAAGFEAPIAEFSHGFGPTQGNSVTGGYVYRGAVEALQGEYVFGDFITGNIFSFPEAATASGGTLPSSAFTIRTTQFAPDAGAINNISSFGEDDSGNLYILDIDGEIFRFERR
jgi:glucose/arabinose dehydrogenase